MSIGHDPKIARELVVRKWFALEKDLCDPRACSDGDLRRCEIGCSESQAHHALEVDVHALPTLCELEGEERAVVADVRHTPRVATGIARG